MLSHKFVCKYMRLAKQIGEDENPCYSRKIGTVLVDPVRNKIVGTGYNGPPKKVPHATTYVHLERVVWPQLSQTEKEFAARRFNLPDNYLTDQEKKKGFLDHATNCGVCPRRLVGARSDERLELCGCLHSEVNAIFNAGCDLHGAWAFCWCGVPCWNCTASLIQNGISRVHVLEEEEDYSFSSRYMFAEAGVDLIIHAASFYLEG